MRSLRTVKPGPWAFGSGKNESSQNWMTQGLCVLIPFWERGGIPQEIRSKKFGSVTGALWQKGRNFYNMLFDGTDDVVDYGDHPNFKLPSTAITVYCRATLKNSGSTNAGFFGKRHTDGEPYMSYVLGRKLDGGGSYSVISSLVVNSSRNTVVASIGTQSPDIYLNWFLSWISGETIETFVFTDTGVLILDTGTGSVSGTITYSTDSLRVGRAENSGVSYNGNIDKCAVWTRKFTKDECRSIAINNFSLLVPNFLEPTPISFMGMGGAMATAGIASTTWTALVPTVTVGVPAIAGICTSTWTALAATAANLAEAPDAGICTATWAALAPTAANLAETPQTLIVDNFIWTALSPNASVGTFATAGICTATWVALAPTAANTQENGTPNLATSTWTALDATAANTQENATPNIATSTWTALAPTAQVGVVALAGICNCAFSALDVTAANLSEAPSANIATTTWTALAPTAANFAEAPSANICPTVWNALECVATVGVTGNANICTATWVALASTVAITVESANANIATSTWAALDAAAANSLDNGISDICPTVWTALAPTAANTQESVTPDICPTVWTALSCSGALQLGNAVNISPTVWTALAPTVENSLENGIPGLGLSTWNALACTAQVPLESATCNLSTSTWLALGAAGFVKVSVFTPIIFNRVELVRSITNVVEV